MDLSEYRTKFHKMELDYSFFDFKIEEFNIWEIVRQDVYHYGLMKSLFKHQKVKRSKINFFQILRGINEIRKLNKNLYFFKGQSDIMLFPDKRKLNFDGQKIDQFTYFVDNKKNNEDILRCERNLLFTDSAAYYGNVPYLLLRFIKRRLRKSFFSEKSNFVIHSINDGIKIGLDMDDNLSHLIKDIFLNDYIYFKYYEKILNNIKPIKILLVDWYSNKSIIIASKKLGIQTIEFQHGIINSYHYGYDYPVEKVHYFPDKILLFGDYWRTVAHYPMTQNNLISFGNHFITDQIKRLKTINKIKNSILVITGGETTKILIKLTSQILLEFPNFQITLKLHPGELISWRKNFPELIKMLNFVNFNLVASQESNIYDLLLLNENIIGDTSTSLIEAIAFKCKVIVYNTFNSDYMEYFISNQIFHQFSNVSQLRENFDMKISKYKLDYFFKKPPTHFNKLL